MPVNMGIHRKLIVRGYLAFLDSCLCGNAGVRFFRKTSKPENQNEAEPLGECNKTARCSKKNGDIWIQ